MSADVTMATANMANYLIGHVMRNAPETLITSVEEVGRILSTKSEVHKLFQRRFTIIGNVQAARSVQQGPNHINKSISQYLFGA